MPEFADVFQTADWKSEKHVPIIEVPDLVRRGEYFPITVSIGKKVSHPNTTEHHIEWVTVFFLPQGSKFPYQIGKASFTAHGASTDGPDTSGVYTHHQATLTFKTDKPGTIMASSYCNIHGLWQNSQTLKVE